jgi:predicted outer membrane protein
MKNKLSVVLALAALCGIARGEDQAAKDLDKAALYYQGTVVAEGNQTVEAAKLAATPEAAKAVQALAEAEAAKQRVFRSVLAAAEKAADSVAAEKTQTPAKQ